MKGGTLIAGVSKFVNVGDIYVAKFCSKMTMIIRASVTPKTSYFS
jgi:hypothetical protein